LALYSAYDLETPAALNGPQFLADDILAVPLELQGDQMTVPNGKGLGIEIDEQKLQEMVEASKNVGGVERP
jgi:muconate cycloisomerase